MSERRFTRWRKCPPRYYYIGGLTGCVSVVERVAIMLHLALCSRCRETVVDVATVLDIVRQEEQAGRGVAERPSSAVSADFRERLHQHARQASLRPVSRPRWVPIAAICVVFTVLLTSGQYVVELRADDILRRAVAAEADGGAPATETIRVTLRPESHAKMAGGPIILSPSSVSPQGSEQAGVVLPAIWDSALQQTPFDARQLLGAASFASWLHRFDVFAVSVAHREDGVLVRAVSVTGQVKAGELLLDARSHRARRLALVFTGLGRLEVEDVGGSLHPSDVLVESSSAKPGARLAGDLERTELRVRSALLALRLAPIEQLRLTRSDGMVRVEGQLPVVAATALKASLENDDRVSLSLEVSAKPSRHDATTLAPRRNGADDWLAHWLERRFAEPALRARFVADLDARMGRLSFWMSALEELSNRYSSTRVAAAETRRGADHLGRAMSLHVRDELDEVQQLLAPLLGPTTPRIGGMWHDWRLIANQGPARLAGLKSELRQTFLATPDDVVGSERHVSGARAAFLAVWDVVHPDRPR